MKLGYLTELSREECELAAQIGYDCIEAKGGWDEDRLGDDDYLEELATRARAMLEDCGITVSAIALYEPGPIDRGRRLQKYERYLNLCRRLEVDVLTTMAGGDPDKSTEENLETWARLFREVALRAEGAGVRVAFENWPALACFPLPVRSRNIAFTPEVWERMFELVGSQWLGLEFDPSHLVWQFIDWREPLRRFSDRIYHVHAKDTEIIHARLSARGFFSRGWWRYRLPGYGEVDWAEFTSLLRECGYQGAVCVEHEDPVFSGERRTEGLQKAYRALRPLV